MSRKAFRRGVTTTSTAVTDLGEVGDKRFVDGKTYRLVYTATTQAAQALLHLDSADASLASYQVQVCAASTDSVFCVNATGAALASGTYFWGQVEGPWAATYAAFSTKADNVAESEIVLDADKVMGTTLVTSSYKFGQTLVSLTSKATDADDAGPYTVYLKCQGS